MNSSNDQRGGGRREWWLCLALVFCGHFAAVSSESLWIDEALTAVKAMQPDLSGWWGLMVGEGHSDLQMPLYMLWVWCWEKLFGSSEWALRAANLPWMLAGASLLLNTVTGMQRRMLALALALNPFAWQYLNEARPYAMQLGAACMVLAGLRLLGTSKSGLAGFVAGLVVLSGSSMLGMIWAGAAVLALVFLVEGKQLVELCRRAVFVVLSSCALLAVIGGYYFWTLKAGARASATAGTDIQTIGFAFYELAGFSGIGPGRLALRSEGISSFGPHLPALGCYGLVLIGLCVGGWRWLSGRMPGGRMAWLAVCAVLPVAVLIGAGLMLHFRVVGRHFTPLEGLWVLMVSGGLTVLWRDQRRLNRTIVVGFLFFSMVSCLLLRFAPWHARDDYRGAAGLAKEAVSRGELVWWVAALEGGQYYGVPLGIEGSENGPVIWLMNPEADYLNDLAGPEMVVLSKPDVYDTQGAVGRYLAERGFEQAAERAAFEIWKRKK